jgi:hypothetical protein
MIKRLWCNDPQECRRLARVWRSNMRAAAYLYGRLMQRGWRHKAAPYLKDAKVWRDGALNWERQAQELEHEVNCDWQDAAKQYQPV